MNSHVSEFDSPTSSVQSNKSSSSESNTTVDPELAAILQAFYKKDSRYVDWLEEAKSSNNNIASSVEVYFYKKVVNLETALTEKSETIKLNTNEMIRYKKRITELKDENKNLLAELERLRAQVNHQDAEISTRNDELEHMQEGLKQSCEKAEDLKKELNEQLKQSIEKAEALTKELNEHLQRPAKRQNSV